MENIKVIFKDCSLVFLDKTFKLKQVDNIEKLDLWLNAIQNYEINNIENETLKILQENLIYRVDDWNEQELTEHFISPLMNLINFNTRKYGMFSWRTMSAIIDNYLLIGEPDLVIAKGRREPEIPFFCLNEFKRDIETKGDPKGQCLAAMLVAQELNYNEKPIFGIVVKGKIWEFMVLDGKEYAISKPYKAVDEELFEIVKLLKHLKSIIEIYVKE